ncbi:MAG: hypothetical protein E7356_00765 [Clostridiales bacterium]|nr:hypothetical protein [Clostridiales bacterium]
MFIEKLLEQNPELVKKAVGNICKIDEMVAEEYRGWKDVCQFKINSHGSGVFYIDGSYSSDGWTHDMKIWLDDFSISYSDDTKKGRASFYQCHPTVVTTEWMKFMHKACGDQYLQAFIELRARGRKKLESRYKSAGRAIEKYNKETEDILAEMSGSQDESEITM